MMIRHIIILVQITLLKLIADKKTHKLLGVQVSGPGAVDKMVDIGVTAITLGATLEQLENMDLAYVPPLYSNTSFCCRS